MRLPTAIRTVGIAAGLAVLLIVAALLIAPVTTYAILAWPSGAVPWLALLGAYVAYVAWCNPRRPPKRSAARRLCKRVGLVVGLLIVALIVVGHGHYTGCMDGAGLNICLVADRLLVRWPASTPLSSLANPGWYRVPDPSIPPIRALDPLGLVLEGETFYIPLSSLFVLVAMLAAPLWWRDRPRPLPGHCPQCGYDLTGNVSGRCPECGRAIAAKGTRYEWRDHSDK